jgi:hypothetical protein
MKIGTRTYVALGLFMYLLFTIATAPATLFALVIFKGSNGVLAIEQAMGSVWSGRGELLFRYPASSSAHSLGSFAWHLKPGWLVAGRLVANLQLSGPVVATGDAGVGFTGLSLHNINGDASPSFLTLFYPTAALLGLSGQLTLTVPRLSYSNAKIDGEVQ